MPANNHDTAHPTTPEGPPMLPLWGLYAALWAAVAVWAVAVFCGAW